MYKILVVDDEQDVCELLKFNLEAEGYLVTTVNSAEEALSLMEHHSVFDLILLDVMMENISGFQMAQQLKSDCTTSATPIVFITALDDEDNIVHGLNLGADDYMAKPLSMREVKARVKAVLRRFKGKILLNGDNIFDMPAIEVRRRIGMVFQRPNPFPNMSIAENVVAGYTLNGLRLSKSERQEIVERSLRRVGLWDEVKESQDKKGGFLSGGQQQRLCIARALALQPDVLLMDEPTSALDPIATSCIEELMSELKKEVSIIIVTHNMGQAKRISQKSIFMYLGDLIEYGDTSQLFDHPLHEQTQAYLGGHIG